MVTNSRKSAKITEKSEKIVKHNNILQDLYRRTQKSVINGKQIWQPWKGREEEKTVPPASSLLSFSLSLCSKAFDDSQHCLAILGRIRIKRVTVEKKLPLHCMSQLPLHCCNFKGIVCQLLAILSLHLSVHLPKVILFSFLVGWQLCEKYFLLFPPSSFRPLLQRFR